MMSDEEDKESNDDLKNRAITFDLPKFDKQYLLNLQKPAKEDEISKSANLSIF